MKCKEATAILGRMIFEEIPENAGFLQHLDGCASCSKAYNDALKAGRVVDLVRRSEPILRDPDGLTSGILAMATKSPVKNAMVPLYLTRLLAAASLTLVLVFGYEQYRVVSRISALEKQCAAYGQANSFAGLMHSRSLLKISEAGISLHAIERLLTREKGKNIRPAFIHDI